MSCSTTQCCARSPTSGGIGRSGGTAIPCRYEPEEDSFAEPLNAVIAKLAGIEPPKRYHDSEDALAEFARDALKWKIHKVGPRWEGIGFKLTRGDYEFLLEQGTFDDPLMENIYLAAAGRIRAAIDRGQVHFDLMEESHQIMLAAVLTIILYHHTCRE